MEPIDLSIYMESKARENTSIKHDPENGSCRFHVIDEPYDLKEFDNAIRSTATFPAMLMEQNDGYISDNDSANYTNTMRSSFMIIDRRRDSEKIKDVRNRCYKIGVEILVQMRKDQPKNIVAGKRVNFKVNSAYVPLGPMDGQYYGYQFEVELIANVNWS